MTTKQKRKAIEPIKQAVGFTKEQLLRSKRYVDRKDLLNALLDGSKLYSIDEADALIADFMKGKVG